MAKPWRFTDSDRNRRARSFLRDAFSDYIAARVLFLGELPQQAAILSSTAIEKCAKAILALHGNESHGHLKTAHWNVLDADEDLRGQLNKEFIELNKRAYELRYTDDLPPGTNLVIASREFLAEMDWTVLVILSCFQLEPDGKPPKRPYEFMLAKRDPRLVADNHIFAQLPKDEFIQAGSQVIYEVRRDGVQGLLEMIYTSDRPAKRPGFLRTALEFRAGPPIEYDLSHFPLPGTETLLSHGYEMRGTPVTEP